MTWEAGYPATRVVDGFAALARRHSRDAKTRSARRSSRCRRSAAACRCTTFESVLHAPLIVLPIVNHDNNQHASNENLRLQNLFDGIEVYAGVLARLGEYWRRACARRLERPHSAVS